MKNRWDLLPMESLDDMARMVTKMVEEKGEATWRGANPQPFSEQYGSICRHLQEWWLREDNDDRNEANHLTSEAFRSLCVVAQQTYYKKTMPEGLDDRPWKKVGKLVIPA